MTAMGLLHHNTSPVMTFKDRLSLSSSQSLRGWEPGVTMRVIQMSCEVDSISGSPKSEEDLVPSAMVATVHDSERDFSESEICSLLLKHSTDLDYAETRRDRVWESHKAGAVLILFRCSVFS